MDETQDVTIENERMRLVISSDGVARSLVYKPTNQDLTWFGLWHGSDPGGGVGEKGPWGTPFRYRAFRLRIVKTKGHCGKNQGHKDGQNDARSQHGARHVFHLLSSFISRPGRAVRTSGQPGGKRAQGIVKRRFSPFPSAYIYIMGRTRTFESPTF